jgi:uncharacterized protein YyaL (SSP411 family)
LAPAPPPPRTASQQYRLFATLFEPQYGSFGTAGPSYLNADVLLFLATYEAVAEGAGQIGALALRSILAAPMHSAAEGGIYSFSYTPDWRTPGPEQDLADQASVLRALLRSGAAGGRFEARRLLEELTAGFFDPDRGIFHGRRTWRDEGGWQIDPAIYTARCAKAIRACVAAFRHLKNAAALEMAQRSMGFLLAHSVDDSGRFLHHTGVREGGDLVLQEDQAQVALAMLDLVELDPDTPWLDRAWQIAVGLKSRSWRRQGEVPMSTAPVAELMLRLGERQHARSLLARKAGPRSHNAAAAYGLALLEAEREL